MLFKNYNKKNTHTFTVFVEKNPRISGPTQFKPVLFKGQLYSTLQTNRNGLNQGGLDLLEP